MQYLDKSYQILFSQFFIALFYLSKVILATCDLSTNSQKEGQNIDSTLTKVCTYGVYDINDLNYVIQNLQPFIQYFFGIFFHQKFVRRILNVLF